MPEETTAVLRAISYNVLKKDIHILYTKPGILRPDQSRSQTIWRKTTSVSWHLCWIGLIEVTRYPKAKLPEP